VKAVRSLVDVDAFWMHIVGCCFAEEQKQASLPSIKKCLEYYFKKEVVLKRCESCEKPSTTSLSKDGGRCRQVSTKAHLLTGTKLNVTVAEKWMKRVTC